MARGNVRIGIVADASGVRRGVGDAEQALGKLNRDGSKHAAGLSRALAGVGSAFAAIGVASFARDTVKAALDAEASAARVRKAVENAGLSYQRYGGHIDAVIQRQSTLAALDDEDLADSFAKIVTRTHDVNEALRLNAVATDVARGRQISLEAATKLVINAHNGQLGALKRLGVDIQPVTTAQDKLKASTDKATAAQLAAAKATDKAATSTKATAALQQAYAGQAAAFGQTGAGAVARFSVAWENLQEQIGQKVLPTLTKVFNFLSQHISTIARVAATLGTLSVGILAIVKGVSAWTTVQRTLNRVMEMSTFGKIVTAISLIATGLVLAYENSETFRNIVQGAFRVAAAAVKPLQTALNAIVSTIRWIIDHMPGQHGTIPSGPGVTGGRTGSFGAAPGTKPAVPKGSSGGGSFAKEFERQSPLDVAVDAAMRLAFTGERSLSLQESRATARAETAARAHGETDPQKIALAGELAAKRIDERALRAQERVITRNLSGVVGQLAAARKALAAVRVPADTKANAQARKAALDKKRNLRSKISDLADRRSALINSLADVKAQLAELGFQVSQIQADMRAPTETEADAPDTTTAGELALAVAGLTPGTADDVSALSQIVAERQAAYNAAVASGKAGDIVSAADALRSAREQLQTATAAPAADTSAAADVQATIDWLTRTAQNALRGQATSDAFIRTLTGSADIGFGGITIINNVQTLHPADPATLQAISSASVSGLSYHGYISATRRAAGV